MSFVLAPLPACPHPRFTAWLAELDGARGALISRFSATLGPLLETAPYLFELARQHSDWLADALARTPDACLAQLLAGVTEAGTLGLDEAELKPVLRIAKGRLALLAAIAETGGAWTTEQATAALSDLADAALEASLECLLHKRTEKGELAAGTRASTGGIAIFALGKHGGRELNYSSDIDVVAFFDAGAGVLSDPSEATKFYTVLMRGLVALMEERTADGYVFRTDLRLRPDPGSTPIAISVDAALAYYESRGQNWERAAWIKARSAAGDTRVAKAFLADLAPYVWRKHLDFATIADIQAMKRQINISRNVGEVQVEGHNVKLGRGGIREIEFFAQTQQLIAGGRDPALRVRPTAAALAALAEANWITPAAAAELAQSYWFLRGVENRLQMLADQQTHIMPTSTAGVAAIAGLMNFSDLPTFEIAYRGALNLVVNYYSELFTEGQSLGTLEGDLVFTGTDDDPVTLETLTRMGFADPVRTSATVRKWHYGGYAATRASAARAHLTELLPLLLTSFAATGNADETLARFDSFLSRLPSGVQLFALLRNHAQLRSLLIALLASAPRMGEAVIHRAHVMDGLIDPAFAAEVSGRAELVAKIDAFLDDSRDYQMVIDHARIIGQEQKFLISAALLSATITAQRAADQFTTLAETLLQRLFASVRAEFEKRHGRVPGANAALLGFGKMASREMTTSSDLDFIMLYDGPAEVEQSDGERPLAVNQYFTRLTQRLLAAVTAPTAQGVLYDVDMRLRPSGNAGPLATSLAGFIAYHQENAWTWEHLALSRTRLIMADGELAGQVDAAIRAQLDAPRDQAKTIEDVLAMRALMARERPPRHPFDLKLASGGLIDLEFIAQSGQLVAGRTIGAPQAPTAEVLAAMGAVGLLPEGAELARIHGVYSNVLQVVSSALINPFKGEDWTPAFCGLLARLTNYPDFDRLAEDVLAMQSQVSQAAAAWYARATTL